jgi:hypothetical protein
VELSMTVMTRAGMRVNRQAVLFFK